MNYTRQLLNIEQTRITEIHDERKKRRLVQNYEKYLTNVRNMNHSNHKYKTKQQQIIAAHQTLPFTTPKDLPLRQNKDRG